IESIISRLEEKKSEDEGEDTITNIENMAPAEILFTNPLANDRLIIKTDGRAKVAIYDLQGHSQFPEINTSGRHYLEFDFADKPTGLYIMKVVNGKSTRVYRVMKGR